MRMVLIKAAKLLEREAGCIADGYTCNGQWPVEPDSFDLEAKREYDELHGTAEALREAAREIFGMPAHHGGPQ